MRRTWQKPALVVLSLGAAFFTMAQATNRLDEANRYLDHGIGHLKNREWDIAIHDLNEAIRIAPTIATAYESRAIAFLMKGNVTNAIADWSSAIRLDPMKAEIYLNRGTAYRSQREFGRALADFSACLRLDSNNDAAYKRRADVHNQNRDFENAIADATAGLKLNPNDAPALVLRGDSFSMNGQFEKAVLDYRQAIQVNPNHSKAYNGLAWLRATCPDATYRDGREAIEAATKACELMNWKTWEYLDTLAAAFAEVGDFKKAIEYEQQVMSNARLKDSDRVDVAQRLELYKQQKPYHAPLKP